MSDFFTGYFDFLKSPVFFGISYLDLILLVCSLLCVSLIIKYFIVNVFGSNSPEIVSDSDSDSDSESDDFDDDPFALYYNNKK